MSISDRRGGDRLTLAVRKPGVSPQHPLRFEIP